MGAEGTGPGSSLSRAETKERPKDPSFGVGRIVDEPVIGKMERGILVGIILAAVAIRLIGLNGLSLAGDEGTTALAALALLDGWPPKLSGGLIYLRGLPFTFLEAAVLALAGVSEGALRLVPALAAGPRVAAAWWMARPLLGPSLAIAAAGLLAITPLDVEYSRIARMYSLFAALDLLFIAGLVHTVVGARHRIITTLFGIGSVLTHDLAITHAPVAFVAACGRGLTRQVRICLVTAGGAVLAVYLAIRPIHLFTYSTGTRIASTSSAPLSPLAEHAVAISNTIDVPGAAILAALGAVAVLALTICGLHRLKNNLSRLAAAAAGLAWVTASPLLGGSLLLGALVLEGVPLTEVPSRAGSLLMAGLAATMAWGGAVIVANGGSGLEIHLAGRLLLGFPAPNWFDLAEATPLLFALALLGVVMAVDRGARAKQPGAWLAVLAAAVGPMLLTGFLARREALRFHLHTIAPLIVLALLGANLLAVRLLRSNRLALVAAIMLVAVSLRPDQSLRVILREAGPLQEFFTEMKVAPDHRGAGTFVRAHAAQDEWIVAEDILHQKFYIGRVDVWLRRFDDAAGFLRANPDGGLPRDIYTGSRHVGDLEALNALAATEEQQVIWLVTSGEVEVSPHSYRTLKTDATLRAWQPLAWFVGTDGLTRVYRLVDGRPVAPPEGLGR